MDDLGFRLVLIASALGAGLAVAALLAVRQRRGGRRMRAPGLEPGVYLFTSSSCADCEPARRLLAAAWGEGGFVEMSWERQPEVFAELGVDQVPATMVVGRGGDARLYPGVPPRLAGGDP